MNKKPFEVPRRLGGKETEGYGSGPIPDSMDQEIGLLLEAWMELSEMERNIQTRNFPRREQRQAFNSYSMRMASLAVRTHDEKFILLGLLALGIYGWHESWEMNMLNVALHYDAVKRMGGAPQPIFEKAALFLPAKAASDLRHFIALATLDDSIVEKTIYQAGYITGQEAEGFRYKLRLGENIAQPLNTMVLNYVIGRQENIPPAFVLWKDVSNWNYCGSHPDIIQRLWSQIGAELPMECRGLVFGTPALVHPISGVIFALTMGTEYCLRLPGSLGHEAINAGAGTIHNWSNSKTTDIQKLLGEDWVFGHFLKDELIWCKKAYEMFDSSEDATK